MCRNAWSKSNDKGAAIRCEVILKRMEGLALEGRTELAPDTVSFNTVIDTLARSGLRDAQRRAEMLLERMDVLSSSDAHVSFPCEPDTASFNTVINSWAKVSHVLVPSSALMLQPLAFLISITTMDRAENEQQPDMLKQS